MSSLRLAHLKNNKFYLLKLTVAFLFFAGASSQASPAIYDWLGVSGSVRPSYWREDKSFNSDADFLVGSAWLTLRPKEVLGFKLYLEGYLQGSQLNRESYTNGDLKEGYVEKSLGQFDFKVGRQIIIWGRADKINPTDNFSSKDLTLLMTDDEDQRKGHGAFQAAYSFDQYRLIGVWQPEWRAPKYPVAPQAGVGLQNLTPENSQNQFGLKLDSSGGEIDWSISYFDGYNKTPDLKLLSVGSTVQLGFEYAHIQVYGADFAKSVGSLGFRGEIAFAKTQDESGENPLQQNSNIFAVLGADRNWRENFNLNGQILFRQVMDYQDPNSISDANTRLLAVQESITANQMYRDQFGLSLRPSYKGFNDTLEIELAYVTWFKNTDSILKPKMTYALSDSSKVIVGAEFYNGPLDTFFGRLKETSSFFSEFRFLF